MDLSKFVDENNVPIDRDDENSCGLGDYHINYTDKLFYLCLTSKNRENKYENIEINGIYCRDTCPSGFVCEEDVEVANLRSFSEQT